MGLLQLLRRARRRLYLCHNNADIDALSSAYLLHSAAPGDIAVAGSVRPDTDGFLATFAVNLTAIDSPAAYDAYDLVVVVDTHSLAHVKFCPPRFVLVDHHAIGTFAESQSLIPLATHVFHEETPSCSWLIYKLLRAGHFTVTQEMARAALCGFIADSGVRRATPEELLAVTHMMIEFGLTINEAYLTMEPLTMPDPLPIVEALRSGQVVEVNGRRIFMGAIGDIGLSYRMRQALMEFGFDAVLIRLEVGAHQAILFNIARIHRRAGVMDRFVARVRKRFPDAGHWPSGLSPAGSLPEAAEVCLGILRAEFEGGHPHAATD